MDAEYRTLNSSLYFFLDLMPSSPQNLHMLQAGPTQLHLLWSPPQQDPGAVLTYKIYYHLLNSGQDFKQVATPMHLSKTWKN